MDSKAALKIDTILQRKPPHVLRDTLSVNTVYHHKKIQNNAVERKNLPFRWIKEMGLKAGLSGLLLAQFKRKKIYLYGSKHNTH